MTCFAVLEVVGVIAYVMPYSVAAIVPLAAFYYYCQKWYVATAREVKRLDSAARSPLFQRFSETIDGVAVVRAFARQGEFERVFTSHLERQQSAYYCSVAVNRWLAVRLELVGTVIVALTAALAVAERDSADPGAVALAVSYALSVTQSLNWLVRMAAQRDTAIISVERLLEYSDGLPREAPARTATGALPPGWPRDGGVSFEGVEMRYRDGLPLALRGVSFDVRAREKIGLVGRSGSGKSSVAMTLLRAVELSGGRIVIDGVDIAGVGLLDLRERVCIIPQDPVLFSGSVRESVDPLGDYADEEVWAALAGAHVDATVRAMGGLGASITEGGSNVSLGERQLICLSRALLRRSRVLIMDEASSAVDVRTDALIQQTIRDRFTDCTVLTIAHRLDTIADADRVLVMDDGVVAEYAPPAELLADPASAYSVLTRASANGTGSEP